MAIENKKQELLLQAARKLFWKYGTRRVTVEEICTEAGVSKMTFYKFFSNKQDITLFLLRRIYGDAIAEYRQIMDSKQPYPEKAQQILAGKIRFSEEMSQEFVDDLYRTGDPEIVGFMQNNAQKMIGMALDDFRKLQKGGEIRADVKPEFLMYLLQKILEMATDPEFIALFGSPNEMVRTVSSFFFYGIMPVPEKIKP